MAALLRSEDLHQGILHPGQPVVHVEVRRSRVLVVENFRSVRVDTQRGSENQSYVVEAHQPGVCLLGRQDDFSAGGRKRVEDDAAGMQLLVDDVRFV